MPENANRYNERPKEAYSEQYYEQRRRLTESGSARMLLCFCIDISLSMRIIIDGYIEGRDYRFTESRGRNEDGVQNVRSLQPLPGREVLTRLAKLTDILCKMISDLKRQRDIADSVAICITTFSQHADVIQEFQDLRNISETYVSRKLQTGKDSTNMARGLSFAEREINNQQNMLEQAQIDTYTPMMVVMSDGLPTDGIDSDRKRDAIRHLCDEGRLKVIPVYIGGNNDYNNQRFLRGMTSDETLYTMSTDSEYNRVFEIIRDEIAGRTMYAAVDDTEQMAKPVGTESQAAIIDTTYEIAIAASVGEGQSDELWDWDMS